MCAQHHTELDLNQLMSAYQQGDQDAAVSLVRHLNPRLYRFLAGKMGSYSSAEDLMQEVWLRVHRSRSSFHPGEQVLPWLYAIARCVRVDGFRKRRASREFAVDHLPELAHPQVHPIFEMTFDEMLAYLPEGQRQVVFLLKFHGLSVEEVALVTSSTAGAVKQKAHRAYQNLRKLARPRRALPPLKRRDLHPGLHRDWTHD